MQDFDSIIWFLLLVITGLLGWICLTCAKMEARSKRKRTQRSSASLGIVLGSGGHTTEMLKLVSRLDRNIFTPRIYYLADTDQFSLSRLEQLEGDRTDYTVCRIPRAREVKQSYLSSVFTFTRACLACWRLVTSNKVDVLLINGPGTCVPVALCYYLTCCWRQIIYVESICRVKTLSLTCKIVKSFATVTLVQWPELAEKYPGTTYIGKLL